MHAVKAHQPDLALPGHDGRSRGAEGLNGKQYIQGTKTEREMRLPVKDLGINRKFRQTVQKFSRNDGHELDPNRAFGIPSVRNDIDKRGMKSVADPLNYGVETDTKELLQPKEYV